ncbi:MAG: DUF2279 domain-containing protein [Ignavibacteriales bacterium]|nr:MAG: DUF2279 domain-containing protein [Ignavibacteriales bacterium]
MNIKAISVYTIKIVISFAFLFSAFAGDRGNHLSVHEKQISDSAAAKTNNRILFIKYALSSDNPQSYLPLMDFEYKNFNKPASYPLEDGTTWLYDTDINYYKAAGFAAFVLSLETFGYYRLKDLWYDWETTKMHSINFKADFEKYLWMDKFGHFMHAYFSTGLFSKGYRWLGMSGENSILYGALSGWLWMLQIEIADGFFKDWGFSWGDLIANTFGAGFSALQQVYPDALGGIQPKISYQMSEALKQRKYINNSKSIIDDYEGMTFWLAVNAYHYMSESVQHKYPEWLKPFGLALGYAAEGIGSNPQGGYKKIFIGLDYDLRKLSLGNESSIIRFLKSELNIIRLPLPAVRISSDGVWYGLYF